MQNPRLGTRYAKSIIDLAVERGELETVYKDMIYLQELNTNRDFRNLLRSPVIKSDVKSRVIETLTAGKLSTLTGSFIRLLINKARESNLPEVIVAFIDQYKKIKNIHTVKLTTAAPVSDAVKQSIVSQVQRTSNMQNIDLETEIDPNLIGGFILQAGDKLIDASVAYDLKQISRQFENNDFIYKVR